VPPQGPQRPPSAPLRSAPNRHGPSRWPRAVRAAVGLIVFAAVAGIAVGLLIALLAPGGIIKPRPRSTPGVAAPRAPSSAAPGSPSPSPSPSVPAAGSVLPIAAVTIVDRKGDEAGRQASAPLSHDGDPQTAWTTQSYATSDFGGLKAGVGLLIDLGQRSAVGTVRARLTAAGAAVDLRATDDPTADPESLPVLAAAPAAGTDVLLTPPRGTMARYVLVWLTKLPADGSGYGVGVAELGVTL